MRRNGAEIHGSEMTLLHNLQAILSFLSSFSGDIIHFRCVASRRALNLNVLEDRGDWRTACGLQHTLGQDEILWNSLVAACARAERPLRSAEHRRFRLRCWVRRS